MVIIRLESDKILSTVVQTVIKLFQKFSLANSFSLKNCFTWIGTSLKINLFITWELNLGPGNLALDQQHCRQVFVLGYQTFPLNPARFLASLQSCLLTLLYYQIKKSKINTKMVCVFLKTLIQISVFFCHFVNVFREPTTCPWNFTWADPWPIPWSIWVSNHHVMKLSTSWVWILKSWRKWKKMLG